MALRSVPEPKPKTSPMMRLEGRSQMASAAPIKREEAASAPQTPAVSAFIFLGARRPLPFGRRRTGPVSFPVLSACGRTATAHAEEPRAVFGTPGDRWWARHCQPAIGRRLAAGRRWDRPGPDTDPDPDGPL